MNLNKAFVLGRLTRDPERKTLPSGQPVVNFGLATNRYYTTKDGQKQEDTQFHNIVIFGKLAETADQYLRKGSLALFEGRIQTRNWEDATGQKHYRTEIVAERMQLGPRTVTSQMATESQPARNASHSDAGGPTPSPTPQIKQAVSEEEIPVIEEGEPKPKEESPKAENSNPKPADNPGNNPLPDDNGEIDVKTIPF